MLPLLNFLISFALAVILHEFGHLAAARLCRVPVGEVGLGWGPRLFRRAFNKVEYQLRLLPLGGFIKMDMVVFGQRPVEQQLFVLSAGVLVNLVLAVLTWGTLFGMLNLGLAIGNSLPFYQQDGWKSAIVLSRKLLGRPSPVVEWTVTITGGLMALALVARALMIVSQ